MPDTRATESRQLADLAIWFAITYLDSDTDYREYLQRQKQPASRLGNKLILLDDIPISRWTAIKPITLVLMLACIVLFLFLRF
ncbi:MAG TPA: hypothetical protein VJV96_05495 [Candidatus Angelobacter sp.]|jgi:hypothetical protein|nr:hypothetical protein [Candidatus Angelobacter sp.]